MKKRTVFEADDKTSDDDMLNAFHSMESKNEIAEVLKELFDKSKLHMIGDLSKDEIKLATRIFLIADMKKIKIWTKGLNFYMTLLISKDRKSRKEILDAIKGYYTSPSFVNKITSPFRRK